MNQTTIYGAFKDQVEKTPDATAIFDERRSLTYRQLDRLVDTVMTTFPMPAKFIGVVMDHSVEMIATILAVLKTGAAYVPAEPTFPVERIQYMMNECDVSFVLTQEKYSGVFRNVTLVFVEQGMQCDREANLARQFTAPESLAYVLYTSGTTGAPKGIAVENGNVCHYVDAFRNEFHPGKGDIMLQNSVCTFDIFVEEVFATLLSGATLAVPDAATRDNFESLMEFVEKNEITMISGFPYLLSDMNKRNDIPGSIRLLISGGDVLRASYVSHLLDRVEVYNTYGPSETTVCASYYRCNGTTPLEDGTYPIGKPVKGYEIRILDKNSNPVNLSETGEICILGDGVSRGYVGKENNDIFVTADDGRRMYRSGDLGRFLPDGNIAFLRRKDQQVMILGRRVEPQEVESVLNNCRGVEKAVVCANRDESGLYYLSAYLVPSMKGVRISKLRKCLSKFLPSFMIPEFFVVLSELPLTQNGKVNRRNLPVVLKERAGQWK